LFAVADIDVDGADRIGENDDIEAVLACFDGRRADAVVGSQSGDEDPSYAAIAQAPCEVGAGEAGVAVGVDVRSFLNDLIETALIQVGMKGCTACSLYAMNRPRSTLLDEGRVSRWVEVLCGENELETRHEVVDNGGHFIALGYGQSTARTEVVLDVDDEERVRVPDVDSASASLRRPHDDRIYTLPLMSEAVRVERDGAVSVIRIDRPKVNALNVQVVDELNEACAQIEGDASVRAVIVYGGERTFSAGADLKEMAEGTPEDVNKRVGGLQRVVDRIEALPVVTIAAVTGYALGGGCEIAMGCDFRFADAKARLGQPEIVVGLIPGAGGTQRLPRLVGLARAKWMIYTGEFVGAETAAEWGLVDEVADGDVFERALEAAGRYASGPTLSLAAAKRAIHGSYGPRPEGLSRELEEFTRLFSTEDTKHGLSSFEKDGPGKANFRGE